MVKLDYERDYYADLELPGPADPVEVKKQFKKLGTSQAALGETMFLTPTIALKFHPDRNPGREEAAKEKFLVIQAAHEILTDPVSKSKFDAYRQRTSRYPAASGVRGNPWQNMAQDVNQKFGAPPKRPQMPTRPPAPTAASTKHWDWAQKAKSKTESMRANMDAWDRAKAQTKPSQTTGAGAGSSARPSQPREPPQAPRTASQARKQDAAFGNRKGYAPGSPMGDEPPVRNQHYNTSAHTAQPRPRPTSAYVDPTSAYVVDPLSAQFSETYVDNRQRTPYAANVGEKTNPFEPLNVNRAKSMRDGARRFHDQAEEAPPPPPPRQRSASTGSENFKRSTNESPAYQEPAAPRPGHQFQSRASARYSPRGPETSSAPPTATTFPGPTSSTSSVNSSTNGKRSVVFVQSRVC
jgi:curved DNA-binding protein CbpA